MTDEELGPRQRAAETKRRRTRERLVSATIDRYSPEEPITFPTLEEIAEEADVSLPTLYNHFETRYDLHLAAVEQLFDPIARPIRAAVQAGAYQPPDLCAEIVSYVCRVSMLARDYRYLVAVYIQAYFESRQYDRRGSKGISYPISLPLRVMINGGRPPMTVRFSPYAVDEYMDHLFLASCMRSDGHGNDMTARALVYSVIAGLLSAVDREFVTADDMPNVVKQVESLVPAGEFEV